MVQPDHCLFYSVGYPDQRLNEPSSDVSLVRLESWDSPASGRGDKASYYEGNIMTCRLLGMRLPTIYEVQGNFPGLYPTYLPTGDLKSDGGSLTTHPVSAGPNGVPAPGRPFWTASATVFYAIKNYYWLGNVGDVSFQGNSIASMVRCVLP
jgi:hypothetical protein